MAARPPDLAAEPGGAKMGKRDLLIAHEIWTTKTRKHAKITKREVAGHAFSVATAELPRRGVTLPWPAWRSQDGQA
jgi:hypothetical protein